MERRARTIEAHLRHIGVAKSLLDEAVKIGLECSVKVTKLLKVSAAVGLLIASRKRGIPYSVAEVSDMIGVDRKKIFHSFSKLHMNDTASSIENMKSGHLERLLIEYSGDNTLREKAYSLLKNSDGEYPRNAAVSAYKKALEECGYNVKFENIPKRPKTYDKLLAQQQELLLDAKQNNKIITKQYSVRLFSLISGVNPPENNSLPRLTVLDLEKEELAEALGLCLSKYTAS